MPATCCDGPIQAGSPAVLTATFTPPNLDDDVTGSEATVTVKKPDRSTEDVTSQTTIVENQVIVEATWQVPAYSSYGAYEFLVVISGGMEARKKFMFNVVPW